MPLLRGWRKTVRMAGHYTLERGPVDMFDAVAAWEREAVCTAWTRPLRYARDKLELPPYDFSGDGDLRKLHAAQLGRAASRLVMAGNYHARRIGGLPSPLDHAKWDAYLDNRERVEATRDCIHRIVRTFAAISRARRLITRRAVAWGSLVRTWHRLVPKRRRSG